MKIVARLLTACACLLSLPALAGGACYTPAQMQAEQLLRLHSELMVITVTCRQGSQGQDLSPAYVDFTKRNIGLLHNAEQTLISFYKINDHGNPVDRLDKLRTILGNEYGQKSADMSAPEFCAAYRDKVLQYDSAVPADIDREVSRMEVSEHSYAPMCKGSSTTVAAKN